MKLQNSRSEHWRAKAVELRDQLGIARTTLQNEETHFEQVAAAAELDGTLTAEQVVEARAKRDAVRERIEALKIALTEASRRASEAEIEERQTNAAEAQRQAQLVGEKHLKALAKVQKLLAQFAAAVDDERDLALQLEACSPVVAWRDDIRGQLSGFPGCNHLGKLVQMSLPKLFNLTRFGTGLDLKAARAEISDHLAELSRCMSVPGYTPSSPEPLPIPLAQQDDEEAEAPVPAFQPTGRFQSHRVIEAPNYLDNED
jgi:hypothetical protein